MENIAEVVHKGPWWTNRGTVLHTLACRTALTLSPPGIRNLNFCLALVILASAVNGYDSSVLNGELLVLLFDPCADPTSVGLQILPEFKKYFKSPDGFTLGAMGATQHFAGLLVSFPRLNCRLLTSRRCCRLRRTLAMVSVVARRSLSGHLLSLVVLFSRPSLPMSSTLLLRVVSVRPARSGCPYLTNFSIVGLGITLITNAAPVLVSELAYPTQRGSITALYNTLWYFGSIISAWVCYATLRTLEGTPWMWRVPCLLQIFPAVLMGLAVLFIPESPRCVFLFVTSHLLNQCSLDGSLPRDG